MVVHSWSQTPKMAFLNATPLASFRSSRGRNRSGVLRMTQTKPTPPTDFTAPKPRKFYIRPDQALNIATGSVGALLRAYSGALVEGYRVKREDGGFTEYSTSLPTTKPAQPIRIFEFEACPFCKRVREAVTMLDLDVLFFPCPKGGTVYREYVKEKGGKAQFPYIEDPNTDYEGYESDEIISYLYKTYGPSSGIVPGVLSNALTISAGVGSALRGGKGRKRESKILPAAQPIELWGYEASPFVRIVREVLCELEIPYYLHSTARGSVKRAELKKLVGTFQVPYIVDPNTDIAMFESAEIVEYLKATYGAGTVGAVESPDQSTMFMPGMEMGVPDVVVSEKSLDPQQETDEALEKYCAENPDEDECRVYED